MKTTKQVADYLFKLLTEEGIEEGPSSQEGSLEYAEDATIAIYTELADRIINFIMVT